jgi:hypothetical protein
MATAQPQPPRPDPTLHPLPSRVLPHRPCTPASARPHQPPHAVLLLVAWLNPGLPSSFLRVASPTPDPHHPLLSSPLVPHGHERTPTSLPFLFLMSTSPKTQIHPAFRRARWASSRSPEPVLRARFLPSHTTDHLHRWEPPRAPPPSTGRAPPHPLFFLEMHGTSEPHTVPRSPATASDYHLARPPPSSSCRATITVSRPLPRISHWVVSTSVVLIPHTEPHLAQRWAGAFRATAPATAAVTARRHTHTSGCRAA